MKIIREWKENKERNLTGKKILKKDKTKLEIP